MAAVIPRYPALVSCVALFALAWLVFLPGPAGAAAPSYSGVDFISASTGWVVGSDATVLATANGGKTWQTQSARVGGPVLLDVCVLPDGKTGWAVGSCGTVLRTTDGKTWTQVFSPAFDASLMYASVKFVDASTGWICGGLAPGPLRGTPRGAILRTTDGGQTWSAPAAVSPGWCPLSLDAVSATSAVCVGLQRVTEGGGYNAPAVVSTTDGDTWAAPLLLRPTNTQTSQVGGVAMTATKSAPNVVVVGDYSELLPPTPFVFRGALGSALSYLRAPYAGPSQLRAVSMATSAVGIAVGTGAAAVVTTTNGGASWTVVPSTLCRNVYGVDFVTATTAYAVGRNSAATAPAVLKTTNAGGKWTAVK